LLGNKTEAKLESQNHRVIEFGGDLWRSPCSTPCSSRASWSRLPRTVFEQLLNIYKDGVTTTFLGILCQCLVRHWKSVSWCSDGVCCASVCARCPLSCHWAPL